MAAGDKGVSSRALNEWCLLVESREHAAKIEMEELILKLKFRSMSEREYIRKLASGRQNRMGGARDTEACGKPVGGYHTVLWQRPTERGSGKCLLSR